MVFSPRSVSVVANVLTVVICCVFLFLVIDGRTESPSSSDRPSFKEGDALSIPGIDFMAWDTTIVLVVRKDCRFCHASMPFYKRLGDASPSTSRLAVVTSDDVDESKTYFESFGINVSTIVPKDSSDPRFGETPIVLIANSEGIVKRALIGLLSVSEENNIVKLLHEGAFVQRGN